MFDFPSNPAQGQQYTPAGGGATYTWDGVAWNMSIASTAMTSEAPPDNPADGQLWFRASTGQLYIYYNDGNSKQWVQCAGSAGSPGIWEPIGPNNGKFTLNADTQKIIPDLGIYQKLRFNGIVITTATAFIGMQFSTDNGATWKTGATDYSYERALHTGAASTPSSGQLGTWPISVSADPGVNLRVPFDGNIEDFNQPVICSGFTHAGQWVTGATSFVHYFGRPSFAGPCNAIKFLPSAGTMTGNFTLEGVRG